MRLWLNICVPVSGALGLEAALEALVALDRVYLRTHPRCPALYKSGVRYLRDADNGTQDTPPSELWLTVPDCIALGGADCKVLSAWRCAELRERHGELARCELSRRGHLWHVRVRRSDGSIEDPSRLLGMGSDA
jgi:hypothetical protein